ncbi:MAG: hypothetical protein QM767_06070 [Anaeromyxobacter sp.]
MLRYRAEIAGRLDRGGAATLVCNDLTARFPVFQGPERAAFCTSLAATVAEIVAGIAYDAGVVIEPGPLPER